MLRQRKNDIRRLKEEADIRTVVDYCGLRYGRKKGPAQFVECPNPAHSDEHPTNAYFKEHWNTIYCTTCGKNMGAIDILMWNRGLSFGDAADVLWQLEGCPDWYYAKESNVSHSCFTVSPSELKLVGLNFHSVVDMPLRCTRFRKEVPTGKAQYKRIPKGYVLMAKEQVTPNDFLSQSTLKKLIKESCVNQLKRFDEIEQKLGASGLFPERAKIEDLFIRAEEAV